MHKEYLVFVDDLRDAKDTKTLNLRELVVMTALAVERVECLASK